MGPSLARITLRGFKTIKDLTDFEPGDLTVLIGPNGAGKTNFISFFRMLSWAMATPGQLQVHVAQQGGANAMLHDGAAVTTRIEARLTLETTRGKNDYGFQLSYAGLHPMVRSGDPAAWVPDIANRSSCKEPGRPQLLRACYGESLSTNFTTLRRPRESAVSGLSPTIDGSKRMEAIWLHSCSVWSLSNLRIIGEYRIRFGWCSLFSRHLNYIPSPAVYFCGGERSGPIWYLMFLRLQMGCCGRWPSSHCCSSLKRIFLPCSFSTSPNSGCILMR